MKPVNQTILGPTDGNCWPATLASLLELGQEGLESIPNFCRDDGDNWRDATNDWLSKRGLWFMTTLTETAEKEKFMPKGYHGIVIELPDGGFHSCVGLDGQIVHDPHPKNIALLGEIVGYDILIPFNPSGVIS